MQACTSWQVSEEAALVSVASVNNSLQEGRHLQIIDVRIADEYLQGHIPSALNVWRNKLEDKEAEIPGMRLPKKQLAELLGRLGINDSDSIYLYDAKGGVDAARLWWMLRLYGYEKTALINGGYIQWRKADYPVADGPGIEVPGNFSFGLEERPEFLTEKADISAGKFKQIIDVRTEGEFSGEVMKNGAIRGGHIPGSVRIDYVEFLDGGEMVFKSKEEILQLLQDRGLDPGASTALYCHRGVRSSLAFFALTQIAGLEEVANYDGSWSEWSADENMPVKTGLE